MLAFLQDAFAPPRHLILLIIAAWIGLLLAEKRAIRCNIKEEHINSLAFHGMIGFLLGGRLLFAAQNFSAFSKSPLSLLSLNPDLFDVTGGVVVMVLVALVYGQRHQLTTWHVLDAFTPFFAALMIGLGCSHLAAGTAFGVPTELPWAIQLWNARRHPTQVYDIMASLLTFFLIWTRKPGNRPGLDFLIFVACTATWQLFISAFRADSAVILNGLHLDQVFALVVLAFCFIAIEWRLAAPNQQPEIHKKTA